MMNIDIIKVHDLGQIIDRVRPYNVEYLYRYKACVSQENEKLFSQQTIRLSNPLKFNDPFDCRPKVIFKGEYKEKKAFLLNLYKENNPNFNNKKIKKLLKKEDLIKKFGNSDYINSIFAKYKALFGLYCLSEISDNLLMWSHYADAHRGFCLQFKSDNPETIFGKAYKISYQNNYPIVNLLRINDFNSCFDIFTTKSIHWEYEKEWRIIKTPPEGGASEHKFEPGLLTGVIFGAKMEKENKNLIKNMIKKYPKKIALYQASLNENEFSLDVNLIE